MSTRTNIKLALGMCALAWSTLSLDAAAWQIVPTNSVLDTAPQDGARAVVSISDSIYILSKTYVMGSGFRVASYNSSIQGAWAYVGSAGGTSLTTSIQRNLWLIDAMGGVWKTNGFPTANNWALQATNACEGGQILPRQVSGDNNIAVGRNSSNQEVPYVIEYNGVVRMWNGSCYVSRPLPSGRARDIAIWSDLLNPFVVNGDDSILRWNGTAWVTVPSGLGTGVGFSYKGGLSGLPLLIGQDDQTFWTTTDNGTSWGRDTSWSFGTIMTFGTSVRNGTGTKEPFQVAITDYGTVMENGATL